MLTVTIDGHEVQVPEGVNLVEAAKRAGVEIPTYCYHPGLNVVGQCRICFVEVEGMPRLVTACSTQAQDEMVVFTDNEKVRAAKAAVMEFLLANHPLDCPVCDQAGECLLQDYSVEHGSVDTHMVDTRHTFPGFERREIGPHVIQNQNRCIHCTRCIRFTREISETSDLTMKARGNHSYIDTFDGQPLENPWSACVADVCPVGALTVKEFRFRARVWHLDETPSICPGCSIGCSISIGHLKGVVHRFKPRENPEINGWWMCDHGRFLAESLNAREVTAPQKKTDGNHEEASWKEAIATIKSWIQEQDSVRVVASATLSNEGLFLAKKVFVDHAGAEFVVPIEPGDERTIKNARGDWIKSVDAHPNGTGARLMGLRTVDKAKLETFLMTSNGPVLILDNRAHPWLESEDAARAINGQKVAVIARTQTPLSRHAALLLPRAAWIEMEGSYTSSTGRVQLTKRGLFPAGSAKPVWEILHLIGVELGLESERTVKPQKVFEELVAEVPAYAGMTYRRLSSEPGIPVLEEVPDVG